MALTHAVVVVVKSAMLFLIFAFNNKRLDTRKMCECHSSVDIFVTCNFEDILNDNKLWINILNNRN